MAKHQTRRSASLKGTTYRAVLADCQARGQSVSEYLESLIAADRAARGIVSPPAAVRPNVHPPALPLASSAVAPERGRTGATTPRSGNAPPIDFRMGAWVRRAPLRVAAVVPPIPEGSDGEPVREQRTKVAVSKGEALW